MPTRASGKQIKGEVDLTPTTSNVTNVSRNSNRIHLITRTTPKGNAPSSLLSWQACAHVHNWGGVPKARVAVCGCVCTKSTMVSAAYLYVQCEAYV